MKTKVGGAWKEGIPHVKVGGVWKKGIAEYVKVSGVWKKVTYQVNNIQLTTKLKLVTSGTYYRIEEVAEDTFTMDPPDYPIYKFDVYAARRSRSSYKVNLGLKFRNNEERVRLGNAFRAGTVYVRIKGTVGFVDLTAKNSNAVVAGGASDVLTFYPKSGSSYAQQQADFIKRQQRDSPYLTLSIVYKDQ